MKRGEIDAVAAVAQRLAVLLGAGVTPVSAWQYLDGTSVGVDPGAGVIRVVAERVALGESVAAVIVSVVDGPIERGTRDRVDPQSAWRGLAAAWQVAIDAGAPLAPSLRSFASSLRSFSEAARSTESALAAPIATARMVMFLPIVGVLFGIVLGFNVIGTLFATPPGLVCLALASVLMLSAWRWNRRLVRAAQPTELTPGLRAELMAIAVSGGSAIDRAQLAVDSTLSAVGLDLSDQAPEVSSVLDLSQRAGVPAAELLRSGAEEARRDAASAAAQRASVLAVKLMLPLGICILPAFMLIGVAPLLLSVISSTLTGFP
ncbi:MAG: type II secretion system F family protein [Microbacteriaceae bacterium]